MLEILIFEMCEVFIGEKIHEKYFKELFYVHMNLTKRFTKK